MSKVLRLNMTDRTYHLDETSNPSMGGRWMTSSMIAAEVPPLAHPLGPHNKVVFAPGIITGTSAPTSARVSVAPYPPSHRIFLS